MITRRQTLKGGLALGAVASGVFRGAASAADADTSRLTLWYRQPAEQWTEALPIGNGRLGAMIFGGIARERLQLNEDTLYAGGPYDPSNPDALAALPQVRALIAEGKYAEAQTLADDKMMARPLRMPSYQTVGDLILTFGASAYAQDYRRDLDLDTACARVRFQRDGVTLTRESFASAVDQVIVTRITADRPGALDFQAGFETPMPGAVAIEGGHLLLNGRNIEQQGIHAKLRFQARVLVIPRGGKLQLRDGEFVVSGADSAVVLVAIATSFKRFDDVSGDPEAITRGQINAAAGKTFETLRAAHVADHQKLFRRVSLRTTGDASQRRADQHANPQFADQRRSATRGAVLPVRALPADRLLAPRHAAGEPAGPVERQADWRPGARSTRSTSTPR